MLSNASNTGSAQTGPRQCSSTFDDVCCCMSNRQNRILLVPRLVRGLANHLP